MTPLKQILLIILDGWGYSEKTEHNAIYTAHPEFMNHLWETYPHALFEASGEAVGLPKGNIGTSEIGHMTIGIGRILDTDMVRVNKAISDGSFEKNEALVAVFNHVKKETSTLHLMGLVSPGGVHSHQEHLFAILRAAKQFGLQNIAIHVFIDGRDVAPKSALEYIQQLEDVLKEIGVGRIATVSGRYFAMDRDNNWDRIQKAYDAIFEGKGEIYENKTAIDVINDQYAKEKTDEFIVPSVLLNAEERPTIIQKNDGIFYFNFRPDRARELSEKICEKTKEMNLYFVTLAEYDSKLCSHVAFPPIKITDTLAQEVALHGLTQAHIAETEKYAHVTYFLNGGVEKPHENERFILIDSRKDVPTYDLAPHMRAQEIADKTIEEISKNTNFIAINFANADMVGHTGKFDPTVEAIKFEDMQIKRVVEAILAKGGVAFITADHGNAEHMYNEETHQVSTSHSLNPVPGILTIPNTKLRSSGTLADVAPTILALFGIPKPTEMTGENLIIE